MTFLDVGIQCACLMAGQITGTVVVHLWGLRGIAVVAAAGVVVLLVCILTGCDAPEHTASTPTQTTAKVHSRTTDWMRYQMFTQMGLDPYTSLALSTSDD